MSFSSIMLLSAVIWFILSIAGVIQYSALWALVFYPVIPLLFTFVIISIAAIIFK